MPVRTMNVIFHRSEDKKYLVEVARYAYLGNVKKWCMDHPKADIFVYYARPGLSSWNCWSLVYQELMRLDGATVLRFHEILNTYPPPFGNPDSWIALSDQVHA